MPNIAPSLNAALAGRYEIEREIGRGGMATVYLARDVRHQRQVALKLLHPEIAAVVGVQRFLAEIRVTANLQHPNLLPLFDSGEANGSLYYVMPFVAGETLRDRLRREIQLPVDEAVRLAVSIADALDYAHRQGIVHRDLKPENILLHEGQPIVADFGIAIAVSNAAGMRLTQTGISLGTPAYMSPEQATGDRVIDARSDIFSLGALTYEMLTGEPPYGGASARAIIARLLTEKPRSIRSARPSVSVEVENAVLHALERIPADRFATARECAAALREAATPRVRPRAWIRSPMLIVAAMLTLGAIAILATRIWRAAPAGERALRFAINLDDSTSVARGGPWPAAISPDGNSIVFVGRSRSNVRRLYLRRADQLDAHVVPGTENAYQPLFSPDGEWVEFEVDGSARKVRLDGSRPVTITTGVAGNGAAWTTRNELLLGASDSIGGLSRVSVAGGERAALTHLDRTRGEHDHLWPVAHDDGNTIAFVIWYADRATARLALASLADGKVFPLDAYGVRTVAFVGDDLVFVQADGTVMAVRIDRSRMRIAGRPFRVHDPIYSDPNTNGNSAIFVSRTGGLITVAADRAARLEWIDHDGSLRPVLGVERAFGFLRLSPDGSRVAVLIDSASKTDAWLLDLRSSTLSQLTWLGSVTAIEWTADGRQLLVAAEQNRFYLKTLDARPPRLIARTPGVAPTGVLSPDGAWLLAAVNTDLWKMRPDTSGKEARTPYVITANGQMVHARFSPDGKWVAVGSDETGPNGEITLRSFPDPATRIQISAGAGLWPVWSRDGRTITYVAGDAFVRAHTSGPPRFEVLRRDTLVTGATEIWGYFDVAGDANRVLVAMPLKGRAEVVAVPNWVAELRELERAAMR